MRIGRPGRRRRLAALLLLVVALLPVGGYLLLAHHQQVTLPAPSGVDLVGRTRLDWVDPGRDDPLAETPGHSRRLPVWIWYPAAGRVPVRPAAYLPDGWQQAQGQGQGLLTRMVNRLLAPIIETGAPRTHAVEDAPLAAGEGTYPLLILQPGMGLAVPDYTVYAENLASHGYVVVGVNEPGSSDVVVFADGQVSTATPRGSIADDADRATVERRMGEVGPVWTADALFVLDQLQRLNDDPSSRFFRRLDLGRVGLFGHSFGGATALAVCQRDPRCRAGADLDGTPFPSSAGQPLPRPFLFLSEEYPQGCDSDPNCRTLWQTFQAAGGPTAFVTIDGAKHSNFSDVPARFTGPGRFLLRRLGVIGSIAPERGLAIANAYLVAFFDRYVKGVEASGALPAFPEARVASKP